MKFLLVALTALVSLSACSASGADQVATDPVGSPAVPGDPVPTAVPPAPGQVNTRGLVTVVDAGKGPVVCLGPIAEIYPPSCTGPSLVGWAFDETAQTEGAVRFGTYALTGTWDGTELTVSSAVPAALYDVGVTQPAALAPPATTYSADELAATAQTLGVQLPGSLGATTDGTGRVLVDVTYDDGSLQGWADREYGVGVVVVQGQLVDAG